MRMRFPLLAISLLILVAGLWAGLVRLGWRLLVVPAALPASDRHPCLAATQTF